MTRLAAALLGCVLLGIALPSVSAYPERPVRLIVGQAPGGATDIVARAFASRLSEELGQPIVVDNRAGAGGIIGAALVASAVPDGYTLLVGTNGPIAISPHVVPKLQYDSLRDFAAVALFSEVPYVVVVHPSVKATTLGELIAAVTDEVMPIAGNQANADALVSYILNDLLVAKRVRLRKSALRAAL